MTPLADVAIVGYGPVGALLARLLGQRGLRVAVFEREATAYPLPRAVHFDGEVMRVFQSAGVSREMSAVTRASTRGMHFVDAGGRTIMIRQGLEGIGPQGWHNNHYFNQPDLEGVLRRAAEACGGVQVHLGVEVVAVDEYGDHVSLQVRNAGSGETGSHAARYVVGCDGARSLVRQLIGAQYEDLGLRQQWLVADVVMRGAPVDPPRLPDYTVQHCDPERPMTACYVTGQRRRWEMMLKPGDDAEAMARPENVWRTLQRWVSPGEALLERTALYTFRSVIARGWRRGRLMIAGDAAHQTPPFIGQGMCAGIRDCANLAWKLDCVIRGVAEASLLDTYESERWPHVHAFIDLAVRVGEVIQADGEAAAERDRSFRDGAPKLFHFPEPQLGAGVHDAEPPAGLLFPQPVLSDGRRLDDLIGDRFAVLGSREVIEAAGEIARATWHAIGAAVLDDPVEPVRDWLRAHDAAAVVLRPDRYVLGIAQDAAALTALASRVPSLCRLAVRG